MIITWKAVVAYCFRLLWPSSPFLWHFTILTPKKGTLESAQNNGHWMALRFPWFFHGFPGGAFFVCLKVTRFFASTERRAPPRCALGLASGTMPTVFIPSMFHDENQNNKEHIIPYSNISKIPFRIFLNLFGSPVDPGKIF